MMNRSTFAALIAVSLSWTAVLAPGRAAADDDLAEYTLSDLAEHDHEDSCWLAIEGGVYDVTEFLPMHPTPAAVVLPSCGGEATEDMRTKGGREEEHSSAAWQLLENYQIGVLAEE